MMGLSRNAILGKIWRLRKQESGENIAKRNPDKTRLHWGKYKDRVNERRRERRRSLSGEDLEKRRAYDAQYWREVRSKRHRNRNKSIAKLFLTNGSSKTSAEYRKYLPHLPEMSKARLREMLAEAVRNTR